MDDSKIILLMQNNPEMGLEQAIDKYGGLVKAITIRILPGKGADVEECVSDTFLNLWKTIDRLDASESSMKAYLICIARNTALNRLKALERKSALSLDEDFFWIAADDDVEHQVLQDQQTEVLMEVINELPPPNDEIIIRKYLLFESVKGIAARLGLDAIQVKNRLQAAKKKLQTMLLERGISV